MTTDLLSVLSLCSLCSLCVLNGYCVTQVGRAGLVQGGQPPSSTRRRQAAPSRHLAGGCSFCRVCEAEVHLSELGKASRVVVVAGFLRRRGESPRFPNVAGKIVSLVEAKSALVIRRKAARLSNCVLSPKHTVLR